MLSNVTNDTPAGPNERREEARPLRRIPRSRVSAGEQARLREEVRDVAFPIGLRGYDRAAVDRYVERVNRLIAELQISSSPESAIRNALDEVSEETRGLLERAHETADEITARSRARADDRLQQAEREAEEVREAAAREAQEMRETAERETKDLRERAAREAQELTQTALREAQHLRETAAVEARGLSETAARETQHLRQRTEREVEEMQAAAETRVRELDRDADAISRERRRLLDDVTAVAKQLQGIADTGARRYVRGEEGAAEPASADEPSAEQGLAAAAQQPAVPLDHGDRDHAADG
jgi:DivIVA domain-containing protein